MMPSRSSSAIHARFHKTVRLFRYCARNAVTQAKRCARNKVSGKARPAEYGRVPGQWRGANAKAALPLTEFSARPHQFGGPAHG